jgi:hypothetical protein
MCTLSPVFKTDLKEESLIDSGNWRTCSSERCLCYLQKSSATLVAVDDQLSIHCIQCVVEEE